MRLSLLAGLGTPWRSPRIAEGGGWGEEGLGTSALSADSTQISSRKCVAGTLISVSS